LYHNRLFLLANRTNGRAYVYSVASVCHLSSSSARNVLWLNGAS